MINLIGKHKIVRYFFSGSIAAICHLGVLYFLVHKLHVWYLISTTVAFCFAVVVSFFFQKFWTFKDFSTKEIHTQFPVFFIFAFFMLTLNTFLMYTFVDLIGLWYLFAQTIVSLCSAFINYFFLNRIIFNDYRKIVDC